MTKVITGKKFETTFGTVFVPDEQKGKYEIGEEIKFNGDNYSISKIIPPTNPDGKWSLQLRKVS